MEYWFFKDDKTKELQFEIGILRDNLDLVRDLLEDLQLAVTCKPSQYQHLVQILSRKMEEVYERAEYLIKKLQQDKNEDCWSISQLFFNARICYMLALF